MKNLKLTLGMFALVAGAIGAFAFSPAPVQKTVDNDEETVFHWFTPDNQTYMGSATQAEQDAACGSGSNLCARGYAGVDEEEPIGPQVATALKNN